MKKVLCLHGYSMNADWMERWCRPLSLALGDEVEWIFPQGPYECSAEQVDALWTRLGVSMPLFRWQPGRHYCWFNYADNTRQRYLGAEASLQQLAETFQRHGRIDGVLGWSQGSMLAMMLLAERYRDTQSPFQFDWMVLGAGGLPAQPWLSFLPQKIDFPALHVIGEQEQPAMRQRCDALAARFEDEQVLLTAEGHNMPLKSADSMQAMAAWMAARLS
jgi:predicted esterase